MKNVSFKKVSSLSLVVLFVGCSLQASYFDIAWQKIRTFVGPKPAPVVVVPTGKMQTIKNAFNNIGQTRIVKAAATKAMQGIQLVKDHKVLTGVAAVALVATAVAVYSLTQEEKPASHQTV